MPRKSKTEQEVGYARSAWEERLDLEQEFKGMVGIFVHPEHRVGVWKIRMVYTPLLGEVENLVGSYAISYIWPNAHEQSFVGALWSNLIKLRAMVEEGHGVVSPRQENMG